MISKHYYWKLLERKSFKCKFINFGSIKPEKYQMQQFFFTLGQFKRIILGSEWIHQCLSYFSRTFVFSWEKKTYSRILFKNIKICVFLWHILKTKAVGGIHRNTDTIPACLRLYLRALLKFCFSTFKVFTYTVKSHLYMHALLPMLTGNKLLVMCCQFVL